MYVFVLSIHFIVCILLILVVLVQSGKGAEAGAVFGGSQAIFGGRGPASFLSKVTYAGAVVFMLTSIFLSILTKQSMTASVISESDVTEAVAQKSKEPAEKQHTDAAPVASKASTEKGSGDSDKK